MSPETACALGELFGTLNIEKAKRHPSSNSGIDEYEDGVVDGLNIAITEILKLMPNWVKNNVK
jgi:hypothetical protein